MKVNKYGIICALALLSGVVGCEDSSSLLDKEESNDIYENMVFSDPYNATWFLSNIYKSMNDGFMVFGSDDSGGFLGNAVDEGIWKANWDNAYKMSVGAWATTDMLLNYDPWKKYYTAIRAACRFLEHADEIPDSPEPFIDEGVRTRMKGEARFLRALFYYELLKFYGGVPIVTRVLGPDDAAELHGARAGFDEVVEFICSEAMLAAGDLPHVDEYADLDKAVKIIVNAKTSRPSVCNAEEVCLVHRAVAARFLPMLKKALVDDRAAQGLTPVELRLDAAAAQIIDGKSASDKDFDTEYLDYILAVGVVDSLDAAIAHVLAHSTHHSDAIVTEDAASAERFINGTDSAATYVNVSTRFTDGGEFGLGCEMGISTQKLHARGPMGLDELSTYKYIIRGDGQIR